MEAIFVILLAAFLVAFICAWVSIIHRYDRAENGLVRQLLGRLHEETRRHHEAREELKMTRRIMRMPHHTKCSECKCDSEHCKKLECYGGGYVCVHDPEERL